MQDFYQDSGLSTFSSTVPLLISESDLFKEFSINGKKFFSCAIPDCGKAFRFKSEMARHSAIHSGQRPHACPVAECGKSFKRTDALSNHLKVHIKKAAFQCPVPNCEASFSSKSAIRTHMVKHKEEKGFKCAYPGCDKSFTLLEQLRQHERASYYHQKFRKLISQVGDTTLPQNFEKRGNIAVENDFLDQTSCYSRSESDLSGVNVHFDEVTMVSETGNSRSQKEKSSLSGKNSEDVSSPNTSEVLPFDKMPERDFHDTLMSMLDDMMKENHVIKKKFKYTTDPVPQDNININEINQMDISKITAWDQAKPLEQEQSDIDLFFKSSYWMDAGENFEKDVFFSDFHN